MRTGWTPELDALLRRADPAARLIAELAVTSAEDVRRRKEEWDAGSVSGTVITLPSGGARLQGILGNYVSQTTHNGWITDLDPSGAMKVARLRWPGLRYAQAEVSRIRAWLHPRLNGGQPQEVAWWECRVFTLMRYDAAFGGQRYLSIAEIGRSRVQAGGNEGEVVFDFDRLVPGYPPPEDLAGLGVYPDPITYVAIVALKADGSAAGNVGWAIDTGTTSVTQGPAVTLQGWTLTEVDDSDPWAERFRGWWRDGTLAEAVPYIVVERSSYSPATITFSGSAQINLGRVPDADEAIELVGQGETPSDSSLTFEVLADNGTTWVPFRDGQLVSELPGVSARQTYVLRVTLSPNSEGDVTPTVRNLGARAVRRWPLPELTSVQLTNSWGFDPRTLVGSIPTVRVSVLRDGARDFHDLATEILSQYGVSDIEIRLWIGAASLPRDRWMLVDTFELEDYVPAPGAIHLDGVHPSARLRVAQLPVYDELAKRREPLVYANVSLADAYQDLISGRAALPERYLGPGITDDTTLVGKLITDGDAKTELDALAYLAGGVMISSQGQVSFRDVANASGIAAIFPAEEIEVVGATPGLRQAVPEWYVPWDWAEAEGRFRGEVRAFAAAALDAVRAGRLDAPSRLDDRIARWIATEAHAERVGQRHVEWFGLGLILVRFRPHLPHPHLEPGDVVLVETRDFVGRDPHTGRALKGRLWARAVISEVADPLGRDLVAWVRSYADLFPSIESATRTVPTLPSVGSPTVSLLGVSSSPASGYALVDVLLQVSGGGGQAGTLEVWTRKNDETQSPRYTDAPDATVAVQDGQTVGAASFSPDVVSAALAAIRAPMGGLLAKRIFARWTAASGASSGVREFVIAHGPIAITPGGHLKPDVPYDGLNRTPLDTDADAQRGAAADDDLDGLELGGWLNRTQKRIEAIYRPGVGALSGADLVAGGDSLTRLGDRHAANVYRSAADPTPLSNIVQRIGADGNAVNTFGIAEGTTVHRIFRHREEVTAFGGVVDGEVQVDFVDEYQNAPAVSLRGHSCISYHASLGSGVSQRLVIQAVNVSKDGFVSRAVIKNTGATTMHNNDFPSGNVLDAVDETTEVTLNPGGANDDRYTVRYAVSVTAVRTDNPAEVNPVTVVVAIDTDDGTGPIERAAFSYTAVGTENVTDVKSWPNEEKTITVSGLGSGDKIRLRIKSIVSHPPYLFDVAVQGADGAGSNPGSARGVSYTTASDTTLSAVPDPGDFIEWLAQEVV